MTKYTLDDLRTWYQLPFNALLFKAHTVHRENFADEMELCTLLSIKTGSCPEDCKYCPQSGHYKTKIEKRKAYGKRDDCCQSKRSKIFGC